MWELANPGYAKQMLLDVAVASALENLHVFFLLMMLWLTEGGKSSCRMALPQCPGAVQVFFQDAML